MQGDAMKLAGRKAVVTGGARGLGRIYALRLAALGADVTIITRSWTAPPSMGKSSLQAA